MTNIKVRSTVYPTTEITEEQWMKEFNVGKRLNNPMDGIGTTYWEHIEELRKSKYNGPDAPNLLGNKQNSKT